MMNPINNVFRLNLTNAKDAGIPIDNDPADTARAITTELNMLFRNEGSSSSFKYHFTVNPLNGKIKYMLSFKEKSITSAIGKYINSRIVIDVNTLRKTFMKLIHRAS
jgi:hypothetical protein